MHEYRHLHPLQIFPFIGKYLFLLLLPLVRGLLAARSPAAFSAWLRGAWLDLLVIAAIVLFAYLSWRCSTFCYTATHLTLRRGLFFRQETVLPLRNVTTLSVESPWYLMPVHARRVFLDTPGRKRRTADFELLLHSRDADELLSFARPRGGDDAPIVYRARRWDLLFLSELVTSTPTAVLFLATVFQQSGRILGEEFQALVLAELQNIAALATFIPRTTALAALLLLIAWGIGFVRNLLHHSGFTVTRHRAALHMHTGLFTKRDHVCALADINFLDCRQSVFGRFFRLQCAFIHCVGYGKRKNDASVLFPALTRQNSGELSRLLPEFLPTPATLRPSRSALFRYTRLPLLACMLPTPTVILLTHRLPFWTELIHFGGLMAFLPAAWWLLLSIFDCFSAGIGVSDTTYTLRYARGFCLHTVILPREKVSQICLRQSVFQKRRGCCDVLFYSHHERRAVHRVRHLPLSQVQTLR